VENDMPGAPEPPEESAPAAAPEDGADEPWLPGATGKAEEAPAAEQPSGPAYTLARIIPKGPLRKFLSLHEVHVLPHTVEHLRRARRIGAVVLVAFLAFGAWYWVIPHSEVRLQAQYHEGLFNAISVDVRVINDGSLPLAPLRIEVVVTDNATGAAMGFYNQTTSLAAHRTWNGEDLSFKGDQIQTNYTISIVLRYTAGSAQLVKPLEFRTEEPFMNLYFEARVA
jgi:hypothetical protein